MAERRIAQGITEGFYPRTYCFADFPSIDTTQKLKEETGGGLGAGI